MKIVQIITELCPAGAERIVVSLSKGLKDHDHDVWVISLKDVHEKSHLVQELETSRIDVFSLNLKKLQPWRVIGLRKIVNEINPNIVHSHLIHANLAARFVRLDTDYALLNTVHIAEKRPGKWWHFFLDRISFSRCSCQTAVSYAVRNFHSKKIGVDSVRMPVIYNGIVPPKKISDTLRKNLIREWKIKNCTKIIGSVGRLDIQKGYDLFLKILPQLSTRIPINEKWAVVILGEGRERNHLERLAMNLPENLVVTLPGFRQDAADCISMMDLFVMPSRYEGFGLTLVEAMSHGVPILASNTDSLPELIKGYANGNVIDFNLENSTRIIEAIIGKIGTVERTPVTNFTVSKMVEDYLEVYHKFSRENGT